MGFTLTGIPSIKGTKASYQPPTYTLSRSVDSVNEGSTFSITLTTTNVPDGSTVPYTITGVTSEDISGAPLFGVFTVIGGTATDTFTATADVATEGNEIFTLTLLDGLGSIAVTINDTSLEPAYSLSRSASAVNEGNSFTVTLTTQGISNGTLVPYTITGVSSADISGASLTGNFTVNNNTAQITYNVSADATTEGTETFTLSLNGGLGSISVTFSDTSLTQTFILYKSVNSVNEGESFTITLNTTNVINGSTVPYTITGVTSADINGASLTGNFTVNNNAAAITFTSTADSSTEGTETFTLTLNGKATTVSVTLNDTSTASTYSLTSNKASIVEGDNFIITLTTTNIANNTVIPYTITGVSSADINGASLTGNFTISSNIATLTINTTSDTIAEAAETFTISINSGTVAVSVTISNVALTMINYTSTANGATYPGTTYGGSPVNAIYFGPNAYSLDMTGTSGWHAVGAIFNNGSNVNSYTRSTKISTSGSTFSGQGSSGSPFNIVIDLGQSRTFSRVRYYQMFSDGKTTHAALDYSTSLRQYSDAGWTQAHTFLALDNSETSTGVTTTFTAVTARYVRVRIYNSGAFGSTTFTELFNIKLFNT